MLRNRRGIGSSVLKILTRSIPFLLWLVAGKRQEAGGERDCGGHCLPIVPISGSLRATAIQLLTTIEPCVFHRAIPANRHCILCFVRKGIVAT